jgi:hypothetical protein
MDLANQKEGRCRSVTPFLLPLVAVVILAGGCAQTLRQQYMDANDPCSSAREPIVMAGDELDARQRQTANQIASSRCRVTSCRS